MADKLINQLTQIDTIANEDSIPIYDASAEETKKVLWSQMKTGAISQNNPLPITSGAVWDETQKIENGSISFDSRYVSAGDGYYYKIGRIVLVSLINLQLIPWNDGDRKISTNKLPKCAVNTNAQIPTLNTANATQGFRVSTDGYLYTIGGIGNAGTYFGSFIYFA